MGSMDIWDRIPMQKCSEQEWVKSLSDSDVTKKYILESGVCLNPLKMVKSKLSRFKENLPISGGKLVGSRQLTIDIYKCIPGGALPTTGVPTTCDYTSANSAVQMYIFEKTVNIKYYEKPILSSHAKFDRVVPSQTLRYDTDMQIKLIDLYTDIGKVVKDWKLEQVPTVEKNKRNTYEWSMANIASNYLSQGRVIMTDLQYHLEISTSKEKSEIWRSYFTMIDVLSAIGGL
jgi:hypothetical protein